MNKYSIDNGNVNSKSMSKYKTIRLGDVCEILNGYAFDSNLFNTEKNGTPLIRIRDVVRGFSETYTTESADNRYIVNNGDLLIGMDGEFNCSPWNSESSYLNQRVCKLCFKAESYDKKYVFYSLHKKLKEIEDKTAFVTVKHISSKQISNIEIIKRPYEEQKKIAEVLDKCNMVITKYNQAIKKLDILIKSRFIEMFGDPVINPKRWEVKKLKETADIITGNTPSRKDKDNYGTFIEWIKTDNITDKTYITTAAEYLSEKGEKLGRTVEAGSILMACIAGSLRSIGRVALTDRKVAFNQQINAIVPKEYNILFLYALFQNTQSYAQSTVNMALKGILSKGKLEELEYILPPISLQNDFSAFVQQIDKSKFAMQKLLEKAETLYKSLMQEYFG